jgi:hypothetical protein
MNEVKVLQFEGQDSWIGSYDEAKREKDAANLKFVHLDDSCAICLGDYVSADQVIVLPCSHALHERCFAPWSAQICPFDQTPAMGVEKVHIFGRELLIPPRSRKFAMWASRQNQELLNTAIVEFVNEISKISPELEAEVFLAKFDIFKQFFQDFLNIYEGTLSEDEIADLSEKMVRTLQKEVFKAISDQFNLDGVGFLRSAFAFLAPLLPRDPEKIAQVINQLTGLSFDLNGARQIIQYVGSIGNEISTQLSLEVKRKFFTDHFKAIKVLPSDREKKSYLKNLEHEDFDRLVELTQGGGPTSLAIHRLCAEITRDRKIISSLVLAAFSGLILSPFLIILKASLNGEILIRFSQ